MIAPVGHFRTQLPARSIPFRHATCTAGRQHLRHQIKRSCSLLGTWVPSGWLSDQEGLALADDAFDYTTAFRPSKLPECTLQNVFSRLGTSCLGWNGVMRISTKKTTSSRLATPRSVMSRQGTEIDDMPLHRTSHATCDRSCCMDSTTKLCIQPTFGNSLWRLHAAARVRICALHTTRKIRQKAI